VCAEAAQADGICGATAEGWRVRYGGDIARFSLGLETANSRLT